MAFMLKEKNQLNDWSAGSLPARLPQAIEKSFNNFQD
jgi:hypothetical protein